MTKTMMRPEYDFSKAVRGVTVARYARGNGNQMTIEEELEEVYRLTLPDLKEELKKGEIIPRACILGEHEILEVMMAFRNGSEKRAMMAFVDAQCAKVKAKGLIFFSEAWTVNAPLPKGTPWKTAAEEARAKMPDNLADVPGRREALMALLLAHDWRKFRSTPFRRDPSGEVIFEEEAPLPQRSEQNMFRYFRAPKQ